ncbi:VgrG protein [Caballeronia novacaledonica]|uniref:VgrG protein n=1 Tax=Caballeronia novacaledonica TaxID=1544861 RepID=A0A2U3ICW0_9BURK|nr:PAAR-like domain-containing protein [Caballeronia novacaledonica]SPB18052.1 VgrG protein [Caballeronia novacaledonica]
MSNEVYANGRELACGAGEGKTICAMPDVCFTPPENPATPPGVPVPYPNSAFDSDTTDGSKTVEISGKEIMLKNQSYFKKSTGDEAGCAAKKGAISGSTSGKVYFTSWSMDVIVEGENVVRHLDMTTDNHACPEANEAVPWPFVKKMTAAQKKKCATMIENEKTDCADYKPYKKNGKDVCEEAKVSGSFTYGKGATTTRAKAASSDPCSVARRCRLVPFNATPEDGIHGCCPAQTPDHIVPKSSFFKVRFEKGGQLDDWKKYEDQKAPCMCLEGGSCSGTHGLRSSHHKAYSDVEAGDPVSFADEVDHCADGAVAVAPRCDKDCIVAQLVAGHKDMGDPKADIKHSPTGRNYTDNPEDLDALMKNTVGPPLPASSVG